MNKQKQLVQQLKSHFTAANIQQTKTHAGRNFNKFQSMATYSLGSIKELNAAIKQLETGTTKSQRQQETKQKNQAITQAIIDDQKKAIMGHIDMYVKFPGSEKLKLISKAVSFEIKKKDVKPNLHNLHSTNFAEIISYVSNDVDFKKWYQGATSLTLHSAKANLYFDEFIDDGQAVPELNRRLQSVQYYTFTKHINSKVDHYAKTWDKYIIPNQKYENKCWLNCIIQHLDGKKQRDNRTKHTEQSTIDTYNLYLQTKKLDDSNGLTFHEIEELFSWLSCGYTLLNYRFKVLDEKHYGKLHLYAMIKNNHIYLLDEKIDSLMHRKLDIAPVTETKEQKKMRLDQLEKDAVDIENIKSQKQQVQLSNNFSTKKRELPQIMKFITCLDDIIVLVREYKEKVAKEKEEKNEVVEDIYHHHTYYYGGDLQKLYETIVKTYDAKVQLHNFRINNILMILSGVYVKIVSTAINAIVDAEDFSLTIPDLPISHYENNLRLAQDAYNNTFQYKFRSDYNDEDIEMLKLMTLPTSMKMNHNPEVEYFEIDTNKCYAAQFCKVKKVPVFNMFDVWKSFTGQKIHDYDLCLIENNEHMFETTNISLCYGYNLPRAKPKKILSVKHPSNVFDSNFKNVVEQVYAADIDLQQKKDTVNIIIGLLEKKKNKRQDTFTFSNLSSVHHHQISYGKGHVVPVTNGDEFINENGSYAENPFMYFVVHNYEAELKNGFCFIKEMLLQNVKYDTIALYNKLNHYNIPVASIKTDAFLIPVGYEKEIMKIVKVSEQMGDWKISYEKEPSILEREFINHVVPKVKGVPKHKHIKVLNEWNTAAIVKSIDSLNALILAECAGAGKSFIGAQMSQPLFVCPTQQLKEGCAGDALTCNEFFGVNELGQKNEKKKMEYAQYETIIFEEVFFNSIDMMKHIYQYTSKNCIKRIIANGDVFQLPPVERPNYVFDFEQYQNEIMRITFPNVIVLKQNKRCKKAADQQKSAQLKIDVFNGMNRREIIKKYFKFTNKMETDVNFAYTNHMCKTVSKHMRKLKNYIYEYEENESIICRSYLKKYPLCKRNCTYTIEVVGDDTITLKNKYGQLIDVETADIKKYFIYDFCRTIHSSQGITIKDKMVTVFEWNHKNACNKWFYVACTRTNAFANLSFYDADFNENNDKLFESKVNGYLYQDKRFDVDMDQYITVKWMNECSTRCCYCNDHLDVDEITVERINDSLPHYINNCKIACLDCNRAHLNNKIE
jgi:hypothetical protein